MKLTFTWDKEACVWIATSDDIPGLVLESGSLDALLDRVRIAVPELPNISRSRQERMEYDAYLKTTLDYRQGIREAEQRGRQQALQQLVEEREREWERAEQAQEKAEQVRKRADAAEARVRELERMLGI